MKHEYSKSRQTGIHAVKNGKERVIIDGIWSLEVPAGYSYCAEYEKTATDINGNHYRLQVQKTDSRDFSTAYGSKVNLTVRDEVIEFNNYTSDARDAKEILIQFASPMGIVEMIKDEKGILAAICESVFVPGNYSFYVIAGGRNVMYHGQVTFADDTGLNEPEIAKSFVKSIEPVMISDLATGEGLVRLSSSYLPNFDTGKYLDIDNSFRVPVPEGYETKYDLNAQIKAAVVPKNAVFTSSGVRCKVGFVMYQDPINAGTSDRRKIIDSIKKFFAEQTGINFYNWPVTTVRDTSKGTIVYSTITNTPCDQNTNPFLVVTGGKAYHCFIVITYEKPISDECDTKWDADIITTAWLSRILFKGEKKPEKAKGSEDMFEKVFPDKSLYPHYDHLMNVASSIPGVKIVVNQSGTEYAFYGIKTAAESDDDELGEKRKALYSRIAAQDKGGYDLDQDARKMSAVFHVDPSVFNMRSDREAELMNGYMKRAYMFSALRSFGWTLSDYCGKKKKLPRDISVKELKAIVDFIAKRNWLNYDNNTYCKGLCAGSDLHVYYVPDSTSQDDKAKLLPSQDDYDRVRKMKSISPAYNEILSDVQSLDALRGSLKFIHPAVVTLYDELAEKRNYKESLEGNEADIVYAWCALAMAAKEPFFTEDGPMSYLLDQPGFQDLPDKAYKSNDSVNKEESRRQKGSPKTGFWSFQVAEISDKKKGLLDNTDGYPIRFLPRSEVMKFSQTEMAEFQHYCALHNQEFKEKVDILLNNANKYMTLFSEDGTDVDIKSGRLKNSVPLHALRSFLWTSVELQDNKLRSSFPSDAPIDMWMQLAEFVYDKGFTNYKPSKKDDTRFGAELLLNMEVKYIYTDVSGFYFEDSFYNKALGRTMVNSEKYSLFKLVDVLLKIMPIMDMYYKKATESDEENDKTIESIKAIIYGWSVHAFAIKQPFYVVPGDKYPIDIDPDSVPNWADPPVINNYENDLFTSYGTEIVDVNKKIQNQIVMIPDTITGIVIDKDNRDKINKAFSNVRKIIYPRSYKGHIIVPEKVEEIEVLGNLDLMYTTDLAPDGVASNIRNIEFKGKVNEIASYGFNFFEKIKTLKLPEGLTIINHGAFNHTNLNELYLPESLKTITAQSIASLPPDKETTIYVYKTCSALSKIQKQLNDLQKDLVEREKRWGFSHTPYRLRLKILDSPWVIRAQSFVTRIGLLYDDNRMKAVSAESVKSILEEAVGDYDYFKKCKDAIATEAVTKKRTYLADLIKKSRDDQQLFDMLPDELSKDINTHIETKKRKEREKKLAEINELYKSGILANLKNGVSILERMQKEGEDVEPQIEQFTEKIKSVKDSKYNEAESFAASATSSSISEAIDILKSISPYKDSEEKISKYTALLAVELKYEDAITSMSNAKLVTVEDAKRELEASLSKNRDYAESIRASIELFESLGDYKDSAEKLSECHEIFDTILEEQNDLALVILNSIDYHALTDAEKVYKFLKTIEYDEEWQRAYDERLEAINTLRDLYSELERLEKEHSSLGGFFKKKQRLEVENKMQAAKENAKRIWDEIAKEIEVNDNDD